jgi:hypothetical protein
LAKLQTPPERTGRLAKSAKRVKVAKAGAIKKSPRRRLWNEFEMDGYNYL